MQYPREAWPMLVSERKLRGTGGEVVTLQNYQPQDTPKQQILIAYQRCSRVASAALFFTGFVLLVFAGVLAIFFYASQSAVQL